MRIDRTEDPPLAPLSPTAAAVHPSHSPAADSGNRNLVPADHLDIHKSPAPPVPAEDTDAGQGKEEGKENGLPEVSGIRVRHVSPREMGDIAMDLYVSGVMSWDEYSMLAFQPELHPDYDATVGALTGETARPDQPRDFVAKWEDRLAFERRHNPDNKALIRRTGRIVQVLRQIENPTDILI